MQRYGLRDTNGTGQGSSLLVFLAVADDAADVFVGVVLLREDSCAVERLDGCSFILRNSGRLLPLLERDKLRLRHCRLLDGRGPSVHQPTRRDPAAPGPGAHTPPLP